MAMPTVALAAPCDPSCATCQNAINTFQKQAQDTLAVAKPPNPQNEVNSDTCLGNVLNFSLSSMFSSGLPSFSSIIKQLEKEIYQQVCSAAKSEISKTVSDGNSLLNFNLPSNEFSSLTGVSSFKPLSITNNSSAPGVTFQDSGTNIWNNAANTATSSAAGQAANQVSNWYNNVLP
jgi:hypothetical protein